MPEWSSPDEVPVWLMPHVEEVWAGAGEGTSLILPDNCMDVVCRPDGWRVAGPHVCAYEVEVVPRTQVWGVRFVPGVLPLLLGLDAREMLGSCRRLEDVRDVAVGSWEVRLEEARRSGTLDMVHALAHTRAKTVAALAAELGWSERHLQRKMRAWVGYPARTWLRIRRLRALARGLRGPMTLAQLAPMCGYSDQSHMTRESRALTGMSPGGLRAHMGEHSSSTTPLGSWT